MYKKIASNTLAQIFSKILTAIISIFLIGILTKTLPVELYGSYNKVFSYLWIFAFLADLGLYTIAVREISKNQKEKEKIIWNVLSLRLILWVGIWVLSLVLALFLPWYNDIFTLSAIAIIWAFTLISLLNSSLLALMQSQMKMEFSLLSVVAWKLVNISLVAYFLLVYFSWNASSYKAFISIFIIATWGVFVNTLLNYFYAKKICPIRLLWDRDYISHIFKISLPYGVALFLSVVYFKVDVILLSLLESPKQADISIALYGLPMKIVEVLMVLGGFYLNSLLPTLSKNIEDSKKESLSKNYGLSLKILWSLAVLICLMGNIFKYDIISLIATQEYINPVWSIFSSVDVLSLVFFVLLFHFLALVNIYIFIAAEKQSLLLKINILVSIINIVGNILLIPHYSFYGAALVTLLSQVFLFIITTYIVRHYIDFRAKYMLQLWASMLLWWGIFLFFALSWVMNGFSSLEKIFFFTPLILVVYIWSEYLIFWKKLLKKSL